MRVWCGRGNCAMRLTLDARDSNENLVHSYSRLYDDEVPAEPVIVDASEGEVCKLMAMIATSNRPPTPEQITSITGGSIEVKLSVVNKDGRMFVDMHAGTMLELHLMFKNYISAPYKLCFNTSAPRARQLAQWLATQLDAPDEASVRQVLAT